MVEKNLSYFYVGYNPVGEIVMFMRSYNKVNQKFPREKYDQNAVGHTVINSDLGHWEKSNS